MVKANKPVSFKSISTWLGLWSIDKAKDVVTELMSDNLIRRTADSGVLRESMFYEHTQFEIVNQ